MPEFPDIQVYIEALGSRLLGERLEGIRLVSPFLLRSVTPAPAEAAGRDVVGLRRLGKRIVFELDGGIFMVLHLMIAGRLRWKEAGAEIPRKLGLAAFDFPAGSLVLTEAGTKKRASLYLVRGEAGLQDHDPGGLEPLDADLESFRAVLSRERHTLKRTLTDPISVLAPTRLPRQRSPWPPQRAIVHVPCPSFSREPTRRRRSARGHPAWYRNERRISAPPVSMAG